MFFAHFVATTARDLVFPEHFILVSEKYRNKLASGESLHPSGWCRTGCDWHRGRPQGSPAVPQVPGKGTRHRVLGSHEATHLVRPPDLASQEKPRSSALPGELTEGRQQLGGLRSALVTALAFRGLQRSTGDVCLFVLRCTVGLRGPEHPALCSCQKCHPSLRLSAVWDRPLLPTWDREGGQAVGLPQACGGLLLSGQGVGLAHLASRASFHGRPGAPSASPLVTGPVSCPLVYVYFKSHKTLLWFYLIKVNLGLPTYMLCFLFLFLSAFLTVCQGRLCAVCLQRSSFTLSCWG